MKRDVRPFLFVRCEFCPEEANCHKLSDVRWSLVDSNSTAKPVPICQECHENSDAEQILAWKFLAPVKILEPTLEKLRECCGYVQNGSDQTVTISQDDATRTWWLTVRPHAPMARDYFGHSLEEIIEKAYKEQRQFDDDGNLL